MAMTSCAPLMLASTSPYRKTSLQRLRLEFATADPGVDEQQLANETPQAMATRLAIAKAAAVAQRMPGHIVIAGDQVLEACGKAYGKPGDAETSRRHLRELAGQTGVFHSGMCVRHGDQEHIVNVPTKVTWRQLAPEEIDAYVNKEPSFGSAGAAQIEGLGISLLAAINSEDPSAILGLPLLSLCEILRGLGVSVPS